MPPSERMLPLNHPVANDLTQGILDLLRIKARLPFLMAVKAEAERMRPDGSRLKNDVVLQMFRDCHDMLVIDLNSLRERAVKGIFTQLHQHRNVLRRFQPKDMHSPEPLIVGEAGEVTLSPESAALWAEEDRRFFAECCNKHFDFLFPRGDPVRSEHIEEMIDRFATDTLPTKDDRNEVRAHRYGKKSAAEAEQAFQYYQTLERVQEQVDLFVKYFRGVLLVLTGAESTMDLVPFNCDWKTTARDLADLIVLGNIEDAVAQYGLVEEHMDNDRRYWRRREQFFDAGGKITE